MIRRPPRSTRTDTLFPYTTLFRSTVASADWFILDSPGRTFNYALLAPQLVNRVVRSEEHTSELQSLMRTSYAVFCLKKKTIESILNLSLRSTKRPRRSTKYDPRSYHIPY